MGYRRIAFFGFSWQTTLKAVTFLVALGRISIIARVLSPTDFGLFSLTLIALGLTEAITQTGINTTILQSKQSIEYFLNTAWVISIIRGIVIASLMLAVGIIVSRLLNNHELLPVIALTSFIPIVKGFVNPYQISLQKQFRFVREGLFNFFLITVEAILAVGLSLVLKSVWALVLALVGTAIIEVILSFVFFSSKPSFSYVQSRAVEIIKNAKWLSLGSILNYLNENLDNFLIGALTSVNQLGLYHNAYSLSHKPNYNLAQTANHSFFPIYTELSSQFDRLRLAFIKSITSTMALAILISVPFFIFPAVFVNLILGPKWLEIIPLIRLLIIAGILHGFSSLVNTFLVSQKEYLVMNIHLFTTVILLFSFTIWLTKLYGLKGAVLAVLLSRLLSLPVLLIGIMPTLRKTKS